MEEPRKTRLKRPNNYMKQEEGGRAESRIPGQKERVQSERSGKLKQSMHCFWRGWQDGRSEVNCEEMGWWGE